MIEKLARLSALSAFHRRVLAEALLLTPVFWVGLRLLGFSRLYRWLDRAPARGRLPLSLEEIRAIGLLVNSAAFHVLGPGSCLIRSLVLLWLLRRRGVASVLRIGMQLDSGRFKAHAWVEVDNQPVNDAQDISKRYVAFDHLPSTGALLNK